MATAATPPTTHPVDPELLPDAEEVCATGDAEPAEAGAPPVLPEPVPDPDVPAVPGVPLFAAPDAPDGVTGSAADFGGLADFTTPVMTSWEIAFAAPQLTVPPLTNVQVLPLTWIMADGYDWLYRP